MAQFVLPPPLNVVQPLFTAVSGRPFVPGSSWTTLCDVSADAFEVVRPYIRPCHQRLLNEAIQGRSTIAFLRQILRPHDFRIERESKGWRLVGPEGVRGGHGPGGIIDWS